MRQEHLLDLQDQVCSYKRCLEDQRLRHSQQIKELCAQGKEEEERQRSRALATQWHQEVSAAQRELVEFAVEKLVFKPSATPHAPRSSASAVHIQHEQQLARERLGEAIAEMGAQVEHLVRSKLVMEWQLAVKDRKLEALSGALDASLSAQTLAQHRCNSLLQRAQTHRVGEDGHAWSRVEALQHRLALVSQQLEDTNLRAIKLSTALSQAQEDRDTAATSLQALQRRHASLSSDHAAAMAEQTQKMQEEVATKAQQMDGTLREFVRGEVLPLMTRQQESEHMEVLALSEELCLRKASEVLLLDRLSSMQQRQDVLRRQQAAAKEAHARAEEHVVEVSTQLARQRSWCSLPDTEESMEQVVQDRDKARAEVTRLTADLQVEQANLARAREQTLAQRAAREQAEGDAAEASEALRLQRAVHDKELASQKAMLLEEMRRTEQELKARWQASSARLQAEVNRLQATEQQEEARVLDVPPRALNVGVQTDEDQLWAANEDRWCERERQLDDEVLMLEAAVKGLKQEAAVMQEQLEEKEEALTALQQAIGQAAKRENARAGGAAETLSSHLVASKVENTDLKRKLKKAQQAEREMREVLHTRQGGQGSGSAQPAAGTMSAANKAHWPSAPTVTFAKSPAAGRESKAGSLDLVCVDEHKPGSLTPQKAGSLRGSLDSLRTSGDSDVYGSLLAAAAAEAQAHLGAFDAGSHVRTTVHVEGLLKWLDRSLRLQSDGEASLVSALHGPSVCVSCLCRVCVLAIESCSVRRVECNTVYQRGSQEPGRGVRGTHSTVQECVAKL